MKIYYCEDCELFALSINNAEPICMCGDRMIETQS